MDYSKYCIWFCCWYVNKNIHEIIGDLMERKDKIIFVFLVSFLIAFGYFGFIWLPSKQYIYEKEHIIVEKYIEQRYGFTSYRIRLDNNESVGFFTYQRDSWLSYEVGDYYNTTEFGWKWD